MPSPAVPTCAAVIVGAGRGHRFGGDLPKQYCHLGGVPVLRHTLGAFVDHPGISHIVGVIHPDDHELFEAAADGLDLAGHTAGGETRQVSVRNGLAWLEDLGPDLVLIHDAARPFVSGRVISAVIAALAETPGAIPALPVTDTIKRARPGASVADGGLIETTVDRTPLWRAQTPQGFRYGDILRAHRAAQGRELTDDAAVAEAAGLAVSLVPGDENNFKITTREDLVRAERLIGGDMTRVGTGFDVHRFEPGNGVRLCGVDIAHDKALAGHSDADVALHALTDAILGAIGAGDIGQHFPPTDPQWRGVDSAVFLGHAATAVAERGGTIVNVDVTIICEAPKVGPHRGAMVGRVAEILGIAPEQVNVKATTTEKLGFTGRGEGIAAQAMASVRMPAGGADSKARP